MSAEYVVAGCGFSDMNEALRFQFEMGFPDWACSQNLIWDSFSSQDFFDYSKDPQNP